MVIIAGILRAKRRNEMFGADAKPRLTDGQIRQLEERGWVDVEEPLDYEEIDDEEARFWEESNWDEPEEY